MGDESREAVGNWCFGWFYDADMTETYHLYMTYFEKWLSKEGDNTVATASLSKTDLWKYRLEHGDEPLPDWPDTPTRVYRVFYNSPTISFQEETEIESPIPSNEMLRILLDSLAIVWDGHVHAAMLLACRLIDPFHARYTPQTILDQNWKNACAIDCFNLPDPMQTICSLYDHHGPNGPPIHLENKVMLDCPALRHWPFPLQAARYCSIVPLAIEDGPDEDGNLVKMNDKKRPRNVVDDDEKDVKPQKKTKGASADKGEPKKKGPRKPRAAIDFYTSERFAVLRKSGELDPEFSNNYLKAKKSLAEGWASLSVEEQSPFVDMAGQDKIRYEKQMAVFHK
jgi:hypothetical protein